MHLGKRILSYFLLVAYLSVAMHQGTCQRHLYESGDMPTCRTTHQHEDYNDIHHEHHFHVGIFHFLGHLFESMPQSTDQSHEHFVAYLKTAKKSIDLKATLPYNVDDIIFSSEERETRSLRAPPYYLSLKNQLIFSNAPLRAPPTMV